MKGHKYGYGMEELMDQGESEGAKGSHDSASEAKAYKLLSQAKQIMDGCGMSYDKALSQVFQQEKQSEAEETEMPSQEADRIAKDHDEGEDQSEGKKALIIAMLKKKNSSMEG